MIKSYAKLKRQNKEKFKVPKSSQDTISIVSFDLSVTAPT